MGHHLDFDLTILVSSKDRHDQPTSKPRKPNGIAVMPTSIGQMGETSQGSGQMPLITTHQYLWNQRKAGVKTFVSQVRVLMALTPLLGEFRCNLSPQARLNWQGFKR